ncbi:MAG TPA: CSLREA domain-containing protein [Candidatus Margulisiibacteriota bacterium]|nr:CSLREA domain-containing protein [Candidatus Margulisiibacteriota bacterium]
MTRGAGKFIYSTPGARALLFGALLLALWPATVGRAVTFTVNSTADAVDVAPGNGTCATAAGTCTLRAAIQEANALAGADTINVPAGSYFLTIQGANEDAAASGDLDLRSDLTINGTDTTFPVISGGGIDRVFDILVSGVVTLSRLIIQNGNTSSADAAGGGMRNAGNLTLLDISVRNNTVQGGDGGGIGNLSSGRMQLTNVTISGNLAANWGGGIFNDVGGSMQLVNVTLTDDGASQGGDVANIGDGQLVNTIVTNSRQGRASNCYGVALTSLGHNLDDGESCGLVATGDLSNTNPGLGQATSATFFAYPLVAGSPAIDAGDNAHCPDTDQRGQPRPTDGNIPPDGRFDCDIGAYEAPGPLALTPTPSPTSTATPEPATATVTGTPGLPTLTPTPSSSTVTPGGAAIRLSTVMGSPGDQVTFSAVLDTGGADVGTAQNDITFDSFNIPVAATDNGTPDCTKNPDLADKDPGFSFLLGSQCTAAVCTMRAFLLQLAPPISPIADGSLLYSCRVNISPEATPGEYPLTVTRVRLSNPLGANVPGGGFDGKVVVVPRPTETPTATPSQTATPTACVGDCDHSNDVTIEEVVTMVNIALGEALPSACQAGDVDGDGTITVNEIIMAVDNALHGCRSAQPARQLGERRA